MTDEEALVSELHASEAKEVACRKLKEAAIEDSLKLSVAAVNGAREAHTRWQAVLSGGFPHLPSLLDSAPGFAKKVQQTLTTPQRAADTQCLSTRHTLPQHQTRIASAPDTHCLSAQQTPQHAADTHCLSVQQTYTISQHAAVRKATSKRDRETYQQQERLDSDKETESGSES